MSSQRRERGYLKYWLTLVVATILITAGITWLVMNVGAQGMPNVIEAVGAKAAPPNMVFETHKLNSNTLEIDAEKSIVDKVSKVEVAFRNEGEGPLRIQLTRTSCACVHDVSINGQILEPEKTWVEIPAGQRGMLVFSWQPKKEQLSSGKPLRLSAEFQVNDPQPYFSNGLRLEITSPLAAE
jgi:hypothetical protein